MPIWPGIDVLEPKTRLSPSEELAFRMWWRQNEPYFQQGSDPNARGHFYDYRGAWKGGDAPVPMTQNRETWGYEQRDPYPSEASYFRENPSVSGMASEDDRIVLNPYAKLTPEQRAAVAKNEAVRLHLRRERYPIDFDPTAEQRAGLSGTAYVQPGAERALRETILARAASGDPSSGRLTESQGGWLRKILADLEERTRPHWPSTYKAPLSPERYLLGASGRVYDSMTEDPEEDYSYMIDED